MIFKLAFSNAKKSIKDYLIYMVTITIAFSLMFILENLILGFISLVLSFSSLIGNLY